MSFLTNKYSSVLYIFVACSVLACSMCVCEFIIHALKQYICLLDLLPSKRLCSIMLLGINRLSQRLSNSSDSSGFVWDKYDFHLCMGQTSGTYIWAFCTALCFAVGFPASIAVLWEMFETYKRGTPITPNNFFKLNVSVMDAVFLAFIPFGLLNHFLWWNWTFEATWNLVYALSTIGRPLLMACICFDCYVAVVHPITYHKRKSLTPRIVSAGVVWVLTVASGIAYFLSYKLYLTMFSAVPYIIAVVIIGICDSFILHALAMSDPGRNIHPQKQRAIQTLINSLVMSVISYLPPVFMIGIGRLLIDSFSTLMCSVAIPLTICCTLGSTVMPILHLNKTGKLDRFRFGCCRRS